jgi:hypothetical protein
LQSWKVLKIEEATLLELVRDAANGHKPTIAKLFEQVGLQKILSLLKAVGSICTPGSKICTPEKL